MCRSPMSIYADDVDDRRVCCACDVFIPTLRGRGEGREDHQGSQQQESTRLKEEDNTREEQEGIQELESSISIGEDVGCEHCRGYR